MGKCARTRSMICQTNSIIVYFQRWWNTCIPSSSIRTITTRRNDQNERILQSNVAFDQYCETRKTVYPLNNYRMPLRSRCWKHRNVRALVIISPALLCGPGSNITNEFEIKHRKFLPYVYQLIDRRQDER